MLDERKRRKDFILERNSLHPNPFERDLSTEERALCQSYNVYICFHSKEKHEELLQTVISEHQTLKRLQEFKEARATGCHTTAEANRYLKLKKSREVEEASCRVGKFVLVGPSSQGGSNVFKAVEKPVRQATWSPAGQAFSTRLNYFETMKFCEVKLLFEDEKRLCPEVKLPPPLYLRMQEVILKGVFNSNVTKKADAHKFFKIDASIINSVYDMLVKKGLALS